LVIILTIAMDGIDYIGGQYTLTFIPGQSAAGDNLQCVNLTLLNDHSLENNETLLVTLGSAQQDTGVVRIPTSRRELLITILEAPATDSRLMKCYSTALIFPHELFSYPDWNEGGVLSSDRRGPSICNSVCSPVSRRAGT
jgi:hypothetical protein